MASRKKGTQMDDYQEYLAKIQGAGIPTPILRSPLKHHAQHGKGVSFGSQIAKQAAEARRQAALIQHQHNQRTFATAAKKGSRAAAGPIGPKSQPPGFPQGN